MILDATNSAAGSRTTLDDLFRRAGVRRPQSLALIDPPNRERFTDGAPRKLTYAQADRVISAISARLRGLGLPTDAVVALQLPNTVDSVLALLGVLRAGMIAAPLPLLWHRRDAAAALRGAGAKAILTCARVGATAPAEIAVQAAADLFSIRHVCAFGKALPDGVVPLDDVFTSEADGAGAIARLADPAAHVAAVNFDVAAAGIVPLARNHQQLIAGGLGPHREAGIAQDAVILSTIPLSSFAGIALTLVPWLLSGGTLALHHSFDAIAFAEQCHTHQHDAVVLPGPALGPLAEAGVLDAAKSIIALWRAPERLRDAAPWHGHPALVDVASFGEIGLIASRRDAGGLPAPFGSHDAADAASVVDISRGVAGTLALRGPMVPAQAFPLGAPFAATAGNFVDTGQPCALATDGSLTVTGPPAGIAAVGFYRFRTRELDALADSLEADATLAALPQELTGERLAGHALDREPVLRQLRDLGVNPLIAGAFRRQHAA
jgi:hypothetical protein